jgi:hypothetical protein
MRCYISNPHQAHAHFKRMPAVCCIIYNTYFKCHDISHDKQVQKCIRILKERMEELHKVSTVEIMLEMALVFTEVNHPVCIGNFDLEALNVMNLVGYESQL